MIEAALTILAVITLVGMFTDLFGVFFKFMSTADQETWEHDHVSDKSYTVRRKQLIVHIAVVSLLIVLLLVTAVKCWQIFTAPVNHNLAATPKDPSDGYAFAAVVAVLLSFAGCMRLMLLKTKLKAIRNIQARLDSKK